MLPALPNVKKEKYRERKRPILIVKFSAIAIYLFSFAIYSDV